MRERKIGSRLVGIIGLGCMNLSHAYGQPPKKDHAIRLLHRAYDIGVRHFDTASLYGFGSNELLVGNALKDRRSDIYLASKCGMTGINGKRVIDGRPKSLMKTIDESLQRLRTDHIDLYYLHRWDKSVAIEDSIGAMSELVRQGKVGAIGLSEVSAATLRMAHAVHPIAAVQTEYSLWTRNPEISVLDACRDLDVAVVAFSPLGRGFLSGGIGSADTFDKKDIRRGMPRFQEPNFTQNQKLYIAFEQLANESGCTPAQLALNWLLDQGEEIIPIPGTRSVDHLKQNMRAAEVSIEPSILNAVGKMINQASVSGARYSPAIQAEIDTEEF